MALSQSALSELLEASAAGEADLSRLHVCRADRPKPPTIPPYAHLTTEAGDVGLRIPKLRKGSFFPVILEPRRRIDQALYAVVMEAHVQGISTRSVDDLVEAMGIDSGISKSEVSRICAGLDETIGAFRTRTLDHVAFPYVYLDATYLHVRNNTQQVTSMAVVVATGVIATGEREILGLDVATARTRSSGRASDRSARGWPGQLSRQPPDSSPRCAAASKASRTSAAGSTSPAT